MTLAPRILLTSLALLPFMAAAPAPLTLVANTPLPGITGDFDHFAIDAAHNKLYVSAEVHHSIEVFNLHTGAHLASVPGVTTPHTLAFVPEKNWLLVADGGDASCRILDTTDMHQVQRIPLEPGPDAGFYDSQNRVFYIGNGGRVAKTPFSYISIISVDQQKETGRIRLESNNLESMQLDRPKHLLYVNLRDKNLVGVVDLEAKALRQTWNIPGLNRNTAMAFDPRHARLFIAGRQPGKLFVIDTASGQLVTTMDAVETADDMTFDPQRQRLYITGSGGVTVIEQQSPDDYRLLTQFGTKGGKTSILDRALAQFYIIHTKTSEDIAGLQVYRIN